MKQRVDIIIPVFNEEEIVDTLMERLRASVQGLDYTFRFLLVDDGSADTTLDKLLAWREKEPRLTVIKLSRNWGHQNAYNAGLDHANADAVVMMDGDLEDPPELIPKLIEQWEAGYDIVNAVKRSRRDSLLRKLLFRSFYKVMKQATSLPMESNTGMFSLVTRKVADVLRGCTEKNKYYVGLRAFVGFRQTGLLYDRQARFKGKPKQTFKRLLHLGFNALFAFSFLPIRLLSVFGAFMLMLLFVVGVFLLVLRIFRLEFWFFSTHPGWTSLSLGILFLIALQFVSFGVLGEYLARILDEVRKRPYYLVDAVFEAEQEQDVPVGAAPSKNEETPG